MSNVSVTKPYQRRRRFSRAGGAVVVEWPALIQAPVPPQIIDKGIPTAGLLAQVLVSKYADHLSLDRQERIFGRAGLEIPRSTLAEWVGACGVQLQPLADALRNTLLEHNILHADETPVSMLAPGKKKIHKAYVWAYCTTPFSDLKATRVRQWHYRNRLPGPCPSKVLRPA